MQRVMMLNVVMLGVVMLNVVAPQQMLKILKVNIQMEGTLSVSNIFYCGLADKRIIYDLTFLSFSFCQYWVNVIIILQM
jgi:hypothetical protein